MSSTCVGVGVGAQRARCRLPPRRRDDRGVQVLTGVNISRRMARAIARSLGGTNRIEGSARALWVRLVAIVGRLAPSAIAFGASSVTGFAASVTARS